MLSFIEALKKIIATVQVSKGAAIEGILPTSQLLQRLRVFTIQYLRKSNEQNIGQGQFIEWFTEGYFEEYIRVCNIYLCKLGIVDEEEIYLLLNKTIMHKVEHVHKDYKTFNGKVVSSLIEIWDEIGDEQTRLYTTAQERGLIAWDYRESQWKATGLGRMFLELSPVQATIFFLSIDTIFTTDRGDFHHMSLKMLHRLQFSHINNDEENYEWELPYPHKITLRRLGVIQNSVYYHPDNEVILTSIGQVILGEVLKEDNPLRDTALAIIQSEELGAAFNSSAKEIEEIIQLVKSSEIIDQTNQDAIQTSIQIFRTGKSLTSLRIIYPSIEAIINNMLIKAGAIPDDYTGLVKKAKHLEQQGIIPFDISNAFEVFTSRNRVLHGNYSPPDDYAFPLCLLAFRYLRRLLTEYHP